MSKKWVHVYTAQGDAEASVIASLLESENVAMKVQREPIGRLYGLSLNGLGEVKILVPEEDVLKAQELIITKDANKEEKP